jgi:class 3 adenylate cyclase
MTYDLIQPRLRAIALSGRFPAPTLERFGRYLADAPDEALFRMSPYRFAREQGISERETVDLFLHATHAGILEFNWGVLCPACGWFLTTEAALKSVGNRYCQMCQVNITASLDENVEVAFTVSPQVRRIRMHEMATQRFSLENARHAFSPSLALNPEIEGAIASSVRWTGAAEPGTSVEVPIGKAGGYLMIVPGHHAVLHVEAAPGRPERVSCDFVQSQFVPPKVEVAPEGTVVVRNLSPTATMAAGLCAYLTFEQLHLMMSEMHKHIESGRFLTGKQLVTTQAFQELFRAQSLPGEGGLALKSVTLMFTDLKGSTELYARVGDLRAYGLVRDHFAALREEVRNRGGGIVKTIGDAIMASFAEPLAALEAAGAMHERIARLDRQLALKIGVHAGPCLAVELNERLDYFGQAVNIAARVQGVAGAEETVTTDAVLGAPGASGLVERAGWRAAGEQVALKGIDGLVPVYRLQKAGERAVKTSAA